MQCQENLCNVDAIFAATAHYQKIYRFKIKIAVNDFVQTTLTRTFHVQCCLQMFLPVQCSPKSIKTTLDRFFSFAMFSGASCTTLHKVFTCTMLSQEY